jgi:polyferredoxin
MTAPARPPLYRPDVPLGPDVLRLPVIGRLLKAKRGRLILQIPLLIGAALLVYDGFTGSQIASQNLASVGVWVHYRGFVILALLLAGNLFCMGCPFTLPRTLARRLSLRGRRWPKALRNKWIAIGGLFMVFWLYEWLDVWASPLLTAWLIVAYFVGSFVLEAVFTESAFCKYVCPLGAFNFAYSTLSPTQITARDPAICRTCVGKECINGSYAEKPVILIDEIADGVPTKTHQHGPDGVLGCGTLLFVPQIRSNMDCTLCLDCARACPHDNVALTLHAPARQLRDPAAWPARWDVGALVVALAFMGITNAFGMIPPIYALLESLQGVLGAGSEGISLLIVFLVGNLALPGIASVAAARLALLLTGTRAAGTALRDTFAAFAPAFVPIGAGIWAAHYGFHFVVGALTIIPIFHNFLIDHGIMIFGGSPNWALGSLLSPDQFAPIEVILVIGGYLGSMLIARQVAARRFGLKAQLGWLPYALIFLLMMLAAFSIFSQPMEMRGTGLH